MDVFAIENPAIFNLPFLEAIEFFRRKLNLLTATWDEIWGAAHAKSFTVAGVSKEELLADLRGLIAQAQENGTTLDTFRKGFREAVQKHGWAYQGTEAWRTAVIYQTNLSTAYHAAHWQQMMDPAVRLVRPYMRYVESSSAEPRVEHKQWYNLVLPKDDPWWLTHYPPNGWGCKCGVVDVSGRELEALQRDFEGTDYPIQTTAPEIVWKDWVNKRTGEVIRHPVGIDPGWDYNVGMAADGHGRLAA